MKKVKVVLREEALLEFIDAPSGSRLLGVQAFIDPPRVEIVVQNERFPDQPMDCEAPIADSRLERSTRLAVDWDHLPVPF